MTKKTYQRKRAKHANLPNVQAFEYMCFIDDLLDGEVTAMALDDSRIAQGVLILEYEDPEPT
jgi:hypothetical protein